MRFFLSMSPDFYHCEYIFLVKRLFRQEGKCAGKKNKPEKKRISMGVGKKEIENEKEISSM